MTTRERCTYENYLSRKKLVYSGQTRLYFAASCDCGWQAPGFRVTEERAREDFAAHIAPSGVGEQP